MMSDAFVGMITHFIAQFQGVVSRLFPMEPIIFPYPTKEDDQRVEESQENENS